MKEVLGGAMSLTRARKVASSPARAPTDALLAAALIQQRHWTALCARRPHTSLQSGDVGEAALRPPPLVPPSRPRDVPAAHCDSGGLYGL